MSCALFLFSGFYKEFLKTGHKFYKFVPDVYCLPRCSKIAWNERRKEKLQTVEVQFNPNRLLGLAWILFFGRVDFVWLLMSNSGLLRIKNEQKTPYKKQKTASSY